MTEKTRKYVVDQTGIFLESGKAKPGDVVELTAKEARHFDGLGFLKPYIDDDEEDDGKTEPSGQERTADKPPTTKTPTPASTPSKSNK